MKLKLHLIHFLVLLLVASCGKELFQANKNTSNTTSVSLNNSSLSQCANHTLVRPPVDLLFIWDNSTSTTFLNDGTKTALNNIISSISDRFDYSVMMAPLLGSGNSNTFYFSRRGHIPTGGISVITKSEASYKLSQFPSVNGSSESGAKRARDLIYNNISNNVFRKNAYTMVVIMSNDDDNSYVSGNYGASDLIAQEYAFDMAHDLSCIRGNYNGSLYSSGGALSHKGQFGSNCSGLSSSRKLDSLMFRFMSVVPFSGGSSCSASTTSATNRVYKKMSELVYTTGYTNSNPQPMDALSSPFDSTNICSGSYSNVFDGVNNAIVDVVLKHKYDYWPVASNYDSVDANSLVLTKSNGEMISPYNSSTGSGYTYVGGQTNRNTRYVPTSGEPFTGKMVRLYGSSRISYPDCLKVAYTQEPQYLAYCHIEANANPSSLIVKVNGRQLASNEFSYIGKKSNFNMAVVSQSDYTPAMPAFNKTGYFVRLNSSAIYSNSGSCSVDYLPAAN